MVLAYERVTHRISRQTSDRGDVDDLPDRVPVGGFITFRPSREVVYDIGGGVAETKILDPVRAGYDADGVLRDGQGNPWVALVAHDSPGLSHQGWTWEATLQLRGAPAVGPFPFLLSIGQPVDLTRYAPVHISNGVAIIRGPEGKPGDPGTDGDPGPAGDPGEVSDDDVASYVDDVESQTYAALQRRAVTRRDLVISPVAPTNPSVGTVWIKNG